MKLCITNVSGNHYVGSEDVENSYWLYCLTAAQIVQIAQSSYWKGQAAWENWTAIKKNICSLCNSAEEISEVKSVLIVFFQNGHQYFARTYNVCRWNSHADRFWHYRFHQMAQF